MLTVISILAVCAATGADPEKTTVTGMANALVKSDSEQKARQILRDCLQQHDNKAILGEESMEALPFALSSLWRTAKKSRMQARGSGEPTELAMFLTNAEARLGVSAPAAWRKAFLTSTFSDKGILLAGHTKSQMEYSKSGDVFLTGELEYLKDKDAIALRTCDNPIAVPLQSAERKGLQFGRHYSTVQKGGIVFLLEFSEAPVGYSLSAWDCAKRMPLWKVYGWGTYREEVASRPFHDASLVLKDEHVFVFGRSGRDFYIAAWQYATGKRVFEWSAVFGDE